VIVIIRAGSRITISHFVFNMNKVVALLLLSIAACGFAAAATPSAETQSCLISDKYKIGLNVDASTDISALQTYKSTTAQMLKDQRFAQLDCLANQLRSGKERFPGGTWKLHVMYGGLTSPTLYPVHPTEVDWRAHLQELRQWLAARPKSVTARVALASATLGYAWQARGTGYSETVSDSGWKLFSKRVAEAKQILDDASTLPVKCPESYMVMQSVAVAQEWNSADVRALFDKAVKAEPEYYYYYRIYASSLLPKWGGRPGDVARFLQESADKLGGERGDALYFQVATNLICGCNDDQGINLSLPRIERGFDAVEKQFGVSMLNLNLLASAATRSMEGDPVLADKMFQRIGDQWDRETWKKQENYDSAREWAVSYSKTVLKQRSMESAAATSTQTPDGAAYKAILEEKFRGIAQQCAKGGGAFPQKFETLVRLGTKGNVEEVKLYANGPLPVCLYQTLVGSQEGAPLFPPPPQAPYSMRFDLDAATLTPVVSKQ
jgi:hypothetical protein